MSAYADISYLLDPGNPCRDDGIAQWLHFCRFNRKRSIYSARLARTTPGLLSDMPRSKPSFTQRSSIA